MARELLVILLCLGLRESFCQDNPSCNVKIHDDGLSDAIRNLGLGAFEPATPNGLDALFISLRGALETELVILLDTSLEVRPNHFYLVNKPAIETLFKYHLNTARVSTSLITFSENQQRVECRDILGNCATLSQCIGNTAYDPTQSSGWIEQALSNGLDQAYNILSQPSKALKTKIVIILSSFMISVDKLAEVEAKKQMLMSLDAEIWAVLSPFRNKLAQASRLASTPQKIMDTPTFITKLYSVMPLGDQACAGTTETTNKANKVCKQNRNRLDICMCKLGYGGANCDETPKTCGFKSACPAGSDCYFSRIRDSKYKCTCQQCDQPGVCMNFGAPPTFSVQPPFQPPQIQPPRNPAPTPIPPPFDTEFEQPFQPRSRPPFVPPVTPPRDLPPRDLPARDLPPRDLPPSDPPPRDLPPRDPNALAPESVSANGNGVLPPKEVLLNILNTLLEKFKECFYPTGNTPAHDLQ